MAASSSQTPRRAIPLTGNEMLFHCEPLSSHPGATEGHEWNVGVTAKHTAGGALLGDCSPRLPGRRRDDLHVGGEAF